MGANYDIGKFAYFGSLGDTFVVSLRVDKALEGGFTQVADEIPMDFPKQFRMRYVLGYDPQSQLRMKLYVSDPTSYLWQSPNGTFVIDGIIYYVYAWIGEKRPGKL